MSGRESTLTRRECLVPHTVCKNVSKPGVLHLSAGGDAKLSRQNRTFWKLCVPVNAAALTASAENNQSTYALAPGAAAASVSLRLLCTAAAIPFVPNKYVQRFQNAPQTPGEVRGGGRFASSTPHLADFISASLKEDPCSWPYFRSVCVPDWPHTRHYWEGRLSALPAFACGHDIGTGRVSDTAFLRVCRV